jgi:hypothetical protein
MSPRARTLVRYWVRGAAFTFILAMLGVLSPGENTVLTSSGYSARGAAVLEYGEVRIPGYLPMFSHSGRRIPLVPLPGLVVDAMFWGAALWLFLGAPGALRRPRRRRRGLCERCAYPIADLANCPECGTPRAPIRSPR